MRLAGYENPQKYFELKGRAAENLHDALQSTFPKNPNLVAAMERVQPALLRKRLRQTDYSTPQALSESLRQAYGGNQALANAAIKAGTVKPEKRFFKVRKASGPGYQKKRVSMTAYAKRPAVANKIAKGFALWATTRGAIRLASQKQRTAWSKPRSQVQARTKAREKGGERK